MREGGLAAVPDASSQLWPRRARGEGRACEPGSAPESAYACSVTHSSLDPAQLNGMAGHIAYEVEMLVLTGRELLARGLEDLSSAVSPSDAEGLLNNLLVESFLIHARNLDDFLTYSQSKRRPRDVLALDYNDNWIPTDVLAGSVRVLINRRVAHLTIDRLAFLLGIQGSVRAGARCGVCWGCPARRAPPRDNSSYSRAINQPTSNDRICRSAGAPVVAQESGWGIGCAEKRPDSSLQLVARLPLAIRSPSGEALTRVGTADPIHAPHPRLLCVGARPEGLTVDDQNNGLGVSTDGVRLGCWRRSAPSSSRFAQPGTLRLPPRPERSFPPRRPT